MKATPSPTNLPARRSTGASTCPAPSARLRLAGSAVGLAVSIVVLAAAGGGALAAPTLTRPGTWADWLAERTAAEATVALVRLGGLALCWYLVAVTALGVAARVAGAARLVAVADALAVPAVRRLLQASLGVGLVLATTVAPAGPRRDPAPTAPASTPPGASADRPPHPAPARPPDPDVWPDPEAPPEAGAPLGVASPEPGASVALGSDATAPPEPAPPEAGPAPLDTWEVAPGEHFWSIASSVLEAAWGRASTDDEVARYWRALVAANLDRLAVPGHPDLLLVGQVVVLAPVSGPPVG